MEEGEVGKKKPIVSYNLCMVIHTYNKLVRDRIPEIIEHNGGTPKVRRLKSKEFKVELLKKLNEEVAEVAEAKSKQQLIEELADVQEVLMAVYDAFGIDCKEVTKTARKKRKTHGAFTEKQFLITVI